MGGSGSHSVRPIAQRRIWRWNLAGMDNRVRTITRGQWGARSPCWRHRRLVHRQFIWTRSEEHTSELQSLMRISYAVFCLKKKKTNTSHKTYTQTQNNYINMTKAYIHK